MVRIVAAIAACVVLYATACAADGAAIYETKCKTCHSIGGKGGPMAQLGGPLDGVGAKHDEAWFRQYFKDPGWKVRYGKKPKLRLSNKSWGAVIAYLLSLK